MKTLQYRLDIRLKFPIKDSEVEEINEEIMKKLCHLIHHQENLADNVETARFEYPGSSPEDPTDLVEI